ncbi:MAG: hypothetical protein ACYCT2_09675 [Thermoplasmataceae archaeon]
MRILTSLAGRWLRTRRARKLKKRTIEVARIRDKSHTGYRFLHSSFEFG